MGKKQHYKGDYIPVDKNNEAYKTFAELMEGKKGFRVFESQITVKNDIFTADTRGYMVPKEDCADMEKVREAFEPLKELVEEDVEIVIETLLDAWVVFVREHKGENNGK